MTTKTDSFDRSAVDGFVHSSVDERNRPGALRPDYKSIVLMSYVEDGGSAGFLTPPQEIGWDDARAEEGHGIGYLTQASDTGGYFHWVAAEVGSAVWAYDLAALRQQTAFWDSLNTGYQLRLGVLHNATFVPAINAYIFHRLSPSGVPADFVATVPMTMRSQPEMLAGMQAVTSRLIAPPEAFSFMGLHLNWTFQFAQIGGLAALDWERWALLTYRNVHPVPGVPGIVVRPPFDRSTLWTEDREALRYRWLGWVAHVLHMAMLPLGPPPLPGPFGWLEGH